VIARGARAPRAATSIQPLREEWPLALESAYATFPLKSTLENDFPSERQPALSRRTPLNANRIDRLLCMLGSPQVFITWVLVSRHREKPKLCGGPRWIPEAALELVRWSAFGRLRDVSDVLTPLNLAKNVGLSQSAKLLMDGRDRTGQGSSSGGRVLRLAAPILQVPSNTEVTARSSPRPGETGAGYSRRFGSATTGL
jgi:hypothetical protein